MSKYLKSKILRLLQTILSVERDLIVGGQAVMEGVMMRTPSAYAIACRRQDGQIVTTAEKLPKWSEKYRFLGLPILRGGATLIQSMALGIKALNFSAQIYEESIGSEDKTLDAAIIDDPGLRNNNSPKTSHAAPDKSRNTGKQAGAIGSIIFAIAFNIILFIVAPLILTNIAFIYLGLAEPPVIPAGSAWYETLKALIWEIKPHSWVAFNLADGLLRTVFFVLMIFSMSWLSDIRRVFEYHGAEHKTVFAWENGCLLNVENAKNQPRRHPRCGTSFLMVVMIVAIILFSVIKFDALWLNLVVRIALMPLVAGISYEIIRYSAKKESGAFFRIITAPGIWLQKITTQEPDGKQLEVAIAALNASLELEPAVAKA